MPNSPDMIKPCIYYAIGDVHGEVERLCEMHETILAHHKLNWSDAVQVIVHLGDYVDRGPDSCGAIEVILELEACANEGLQVISLRGNHEQQMLDALDDPTGYPMETWTRDGWGGQKTLESYAQRTNGDDLLEVHRAWIDQLPRIWCPEGTKLIFVHAGVDPEEYPNESEDVYIWTRSRKFFDPKNWTSPALYGKRVIHGHTPTKGEPETAGDGQRINIDTGAVFGGPLTCAVVVPDEQAVQFLYA